MEELKYVTNVDANALEQQEENLKRRQSAQAVVSFDPRNYLDLKLANGETTKTVKVRLLPSSPTDGNVFFDIRTHSMKVDTEIARSGFKSFICLNDPHVGEGKKCPICEKTEELFKKASEARNEGNEALSKTYYKEACSLKSKRTYIVRVIDRDHEDEGVKFWRFNENSLGEGVYDKLMNLYKTRKREYEEAGRGSYNIFDLYNGKDINVTVSKSLIPDGKGGMKEKTALNITDASLETPLSRDIEKANSWINDPKTWKDVYSNKTEDYLRLVVEGKIPFYDREKGTYVEKVVYDKNIKNEQEKIASQILLENKQEVVNDVADDDLPF